MFQRGLLAQRLPRLLVEEDGPSATEYAILLAILVLVAIVSIQSIGERMYNVYLAIDGTMPDGDS